MVLMFDRGVCRGCNRKTCQLGRRPGGPLSQLLVLCAPYFPCQWTVGGRCKLTLLEGIGSFRGVKPLGISSALLNGMEVAEVVMIVGVGEVAACVGVL